MDEDTDRPAITEGASETLEVPHEGGLCDGRFERVAGLAAVCAVSLPMRTKMFLRSSLGRWSKCVDMVIVHVTTYTSATERPQTSAYILRNPRRAACHCATSVSDV